MNRVDWVAGYLSNMRPRNEDRFISMSERAGAEGTDEGMLLAGVQFRPVKNLAVGGYNYWVHPELYERDRETFRTYLPAIHALATAGWEPITHARCDVEDLWVERYGPSEGKVYFALRSEGEARAGKLTVDLEALGITGAVTGVRDLVTGEMIEAQADDGTLTLPVSVEADRSEAIALEFEE